MKSKQPRLREFAICALPKNISNKMNKSTYNISQIIKQCTLPLLWRGSGRG